MKNKIDKFSFFSNIFFFVLGSFLLFELFLPKSSKINVFKEAYIDPPQYVERTAPDEISIEKDIVEVPLNSSINLKYEVKGSENYSKLINYGVTDKEICSVNLSSKDHIFIFGDKVGQTEIKISSPLDSNINKTIVAKVVDSGKPIKKYSKYVFGAIVNNQYFYSTYIRASLDDDIRFFIIAKDENGDDLSIINSFSCDQYASIDSSGNMRLNSNCAGKNIRVKASNKYSSHTFELMISFPEEYKKPYITKTVLVPIVYVFSFFIFGYCASLLDEIVCEKCKNKIVKYAVKGFLLVFPFIALLLHFFIFDRKFLYIYWFITPISYYVMYFMDVVFIFVSKKIIGIRKNKNDDGTIDKMSDSCESQNNKKLVLMIGSAFLEEDENYIKTSYFKKNPTLSNPQYEKKLITGFLENKEYDFLFLSAPQVGYWPSRSKKLFVKGFHESDYLKTVKYCSPLGLLQFFKGRGLINRINSLKDTLKTYNKIHVVCGECHKPYLQTVKYLKSKFDNVFSTVICPDLPSDIITYKNFVYKFLKEKNIKATQKLCDLYADSFLCFTSGIEKVVNKTNKPFAVIEGVIDARTPGKIGSDVKHIVYIGKTDKRNGIELLLETAHLFGKDYIFDIYGNGDFDDVLKTQQNENVIWHSYLSPKDIDDVMLNTDVAISLRKNEGEYVNYSFPSKIFDYLSYKKPVVTFKLPCYFKELDEVLTYPDGETPEDIKKSIEKALNRKYDDSIYDSLFNKYSPRSITTAIINLGNFDGENK